MSASVAPCRKARSFGSPDAGSSKPGVTRSQWPPWSVVRKICGTTNVETKDTPGFPSATTRCVSAPDTGSASKLVPDRSSASVVETSPLTFTEGRVATL